MSLLPRIPIPNRSFVDDTTFVDLLPISWFEIEMKMAGSMRLDEYERFNKENPPVIRYDKIKDPRVVSYVALTMAEKLAFLSAYEYEYNPYSSAVCLKKKSFAEELNANPRLAVLKAAIEEIKQNEEKKEDNVDKSKKHKKDKVLGDDVNDKPKLKKKSIPKVLKASVWITHIGKAIGMTKCPCCGVEDITQLNFECGHVVAESSGGETVISNLRPVCAGCNKSMGTMNMNEFIVKHFPKK